MKLSNSLILLFLILILADTCFSFYQHYQMPLDGDIAESVVPADFVKKVISDPFALHVLIYGESYPNPNRAVAHASMMIYLRNIPLFLQKFFSPIESVYIANAIIKTGIQILLIYLLSYLVVVSNGTFRWKDLILSGLILIPLFQTEGYNRFMGIVDKSVSYTFFYAWPCALMILFLVPAYLSLLNGSFYRLTIFSKVILLTLAILLPFSGPLIPAVLCIITFILIAYLIKTKRVSEFVNNCKFIFATVLLSFFLSIYSLYIGTFNISNELVVVSIAERFLKLPAGLYFIFTGKPGWLFFAVMIAMNVWLTRKYHATRINKIFNWILIFSAIYILLLPFGGFREYRPNIVRYDTFLPVTLSMIFYFGLSTIYLIRHIHPSWKKLYIVFITCFLLIFTFADKHTGSGNVCEKSALQIISASNKDTVYVPTTCTILSWNMISNPEASKSNAEVLQLWNITAQKKYYFQ